MLLYCFILIVINIKVCSNLEHVWHSYQFSPNYENREEFTLKDITTDKNFLLNFNITKWKSLKVEKHCYLMGLTEINNNLAIVSFTLNTTKSFSYNYRIIESATKPTDVFLFETWNSTIKKNEAIVVVSSNTSLIWFKLQDTNLTEFWQWPLQKPISHINIFQVNYNYQLFVVSTYNNQTTGDFYEFQLNPPNFWLRHKIPLEGPVKSTAFTNFGPDYFLSIPQTSLKSLLIYKLENSFVSYKNITSPKIDQVVSFEGDSKSFLAINGLRAAIYRFTYSGLVKEKVAQSNLDGINFWLPISLSFHRDELLLLAQRHINNGYYHSLAVEMFTYNGNRFEEHEDIPCYYFGESLMGLNCLIDEDDKSGIIGAAPVEVENKLGLVVSRKNRHSDLFFLTSKVKQIPDPVDKEIEQLYEMKERLGKLMKTEEEDYKRLFVKQTVESLGATKDEILRFSLLDLDPEESQMTIDLVIEEVDKLKVRLDELIAKQTFKTVVLNGKTHIKEGVFESVQVDNINGEIADDLINDLVKKDDLKLISGRKHFRNLEIEDLNFSEINGINATNLVFQSPTITINGNLILNQTLKILENFSGLVNDLNLETEVVSLNQPIDHLTFEDVHVLNNFQVGNLNGNELKNSSFNQNLTRENFYAPYNLTVQNINGINFDSFVNEICMKNIKCSLPGTTEVLGDVSVKHKATINFLNKQKFPESFLFKNNNINTNITGVKFFEESLTANELHSKGLINDYDTSRIINLYTNQNITGNIILNDLELTTSFNLIGNVTGKFLDEFLPNPTIETQTYIKSNVNFDNLEVTGSIVLLNEFNGEKFEDFLSCFIYDDEEEVIIDALKKFPNGLTVRNNLIIESNTINNISLDSIVTKNTEQVLNCNTLNGTITFDNIHTTGLYNSINIGKLDETTVKVSGDQHVSSELFFEEFEVGNLEIIETLNNLTSEEYFRINSSQEINNDVDFEEVKVENLYVDGDFEGTIENFDLEEFQNNYLNYNDQKINGNFKISELIVQELTTEHINNVSFPDYFNHDLIQEKIRTKLENEPIKIKNLFVNGSVKILKINNQDAFNLGSFSKFNLTNVTFQNDLYVDDLVINKLSDVSFAKFVKNLVFKNETSPHLRGYKTFLKGFTVEKLVETEKLNNVPVDEILTKEGIQHFTGPLIINGNVTFEDDVNITDGIEDIPLDYVRENFKFSDGIYRIQGDVLFSRLTHIKHLQINGYHSKDSVQEIIDNLVYKNKDFSLTGRVVFRNNVQISGNLGVNNTINHINLHSFASDVVLISSDDTIKSSVIFKEGTEIKSHLILDNNLKTQFINGFELDNWLKNAVFINKGLLNGNFTFENAVIHDFIQTTYINNFKVDSLIPLKTNQHINNLSVSELVSYNDINVGNLVNGYNLSRELSNTVMTDSNQEITSEVVFNGNVYVRNLETDKINGKYLDKIVTIDTNQNLTAIYNFTSKSVIEGDLIVDGLVNFINVTDWSEKSLKIASSPQNIRDAWHLQDLVFQEVTGNGLINNMDLQHFSQLVQKKKTDRLELEQNLISNYANLCNDLNFMYQKARKQIYKFDYFEHFQDFEFANVLQYVHYFKTENNFLLINQQDSCNSLLFGYDNKSFSYIKNIETGLISQIVNVHKKNSHYLVIKNDPALNCDIQGTNVWEVATENLTHIFVMDDQELLQESRVPGTFYGLSKHTVTEFRLDFQVNKYRKWNTEEENAAFVPHGLATGLALRTGTKLIYLNRDDPVEEDNFESSTIIGSVTTQINTNLPGRSDGNDVVVLSVGVRSSKSNLVAVASHEETSVEGSFDSIKIFEDAITGKMFHKVSTYKPSSLISLELGNGETLLVFMEDGKMLQVYEYKGIEGFRHRLSANLEAAQLFSMTLPVLHYLNDRKIVGLIDKNRLILIEALMLGNKIEEELNC